MSSQVFTVLSQVDEIIWPEVNTLRPIDSYLDGVQETSFEDIERELMDRFNVPLFEPLPFTREDLQRYSHVRNRVCEVIQNQSPKLRKELAAVMAAIGAVPYLLRSCF